MPSQVLIIDNNHETRRVIAQQLRAELGNMEIIQANSSQEALHIMKEANSIDWIICEWDLPDQPGIELLKKVRNSKRYATNPFVLLTSVQDKGRLEKAVAAGVTDIIAKPFNVATLNKKLERLATLAAAS